MKTNLVKTLLLVFCLSIALMGVSCIKETGNFGSEILPITSESISQSKDFETTSTEESVSEYISQGIIYNLSEDGESYIVVGVVDCTETNIVIPSTYNKLPITSIGDYAFSECSSLTSVTIGENVTSIGDYAFNYCASIRSIEIPNNVTSIGDYAFNFCIGLTSITIGESVKSIGEEAFEECVKLVEVINKSNHITIEKGKAYYGKVGYYALSVSNRDKAYSSKITNNNGYIIYTEDELKILVGYEGTETNLIIPDYITRINSYAFYYCYSLTSVIIGEGIDLIGDFAFFWCEGLTSVVISDSVKYIGRNVFTSCHSLISVIIGENVKSIGDEAFEECFKLVEVINKSNYITVKVGEPFNGMVGYYALSVSNRNNAYSSKLTNDNGYIIYRKDEEKILVGYNGTETDLIIPNYVVRIYDYAFCDKYNLTSIIIGDNVKYIGEYAFKFCHSLKSVIIGDGVMNISSSAFYYCNSLTSIQIPDSVKDIGYGAFAYCSSLTNIVIGEGVTSIGDEAFEDCFKLVEVINKSSYITVNAGSDSYGKVGYYALAVSNCEDTYISKINNDNGCIVYVHDAEKILLCYNGSETDLEIPNYITQIYKYAFENCEGLTSVTFKDTFNWYIKGNRIDVTNASQNATYLTSTYCDCFWYKG